MMMVDISKITRDYYIKEYYIMKHEHTNLEFPFDAFL